MKKDEEMRASEKSSLYSRRSSSSFESQRAELRSFFLEK
jgi:hypothetical protein